jgi:hypothetical protein
MSVAAGRSNWRRGVAYLHAPAVATLSQFIGLVQIVLLTRSGGAGRGSDAYFFLYSMAFLPTQILLAGLLYPLLLSQTGAAPQTLQRLKALTPWSCVLMVMLGVFWLWHLGHLTPQLYALAILSALNGFVAAKLWYHCLELTADGEVIWLAGIALPANLLACVSIGYAWTPSSLRATVMVGGLLIGNIALFAYLRATGRTKSAPRSAHSAAAASAAPRSSGWFLAKSITGYASQDALEALALLLPAASLTILNILNRIVGSISTAMVSSILPKLVNRDSATQTDAANFARWFAVLLAVPFCLVAATTLIVSIPYQEYVLTTLAWLLVSGMNVSAQRMAYRFLAPSASVLSIVSAAAVVVFVIAASLTPWFSLKILFVSAIALDALPATFLLWTLSERVIGLVTFLVFVASAGLLIGVE